MKLSDILVDLYEGAEEKIRHISVSMENPLTTASQKDHSARNISSIEELLKEISKGDPTDGKSLQWLARMYAKGLFKIEDIKRISKELTLFYTIRPKLENKDLNSYKTLSDLYNATEPFEKTAEEPVSKRGAKRKLKQEEATPIINTKDYKAYQIHTHAAACLYGANTKWCTAARDDPDTFDYYKKQGPLFIIIAKNPKTNKDRKFQIHVESDQFMNERDENMTQKEINFLSQFPGHEKFLNYLIDHHYAKHIQ